LRTMDELQGNRDEIVASDRTEFPKITNVWTVEPVREQFKEQDRGLGGLRTLDSLLKVLSRFQYPSFF
jgi:hypothetical protein